MPFAEASQRPEEKSESNPHEGAILSETRIVQRKERDLVNQMSSTGLNPHAKTFVST